MVLVIGDDAPTIFVKRFTGVCIFIAPGGESFPRRDVVHLCAQDLGGDMRMAIEIDSPHSQQGTVSNLNRTVTVALLASSRAIRTLASGWPSSFRPLRIAKAI